MNNYDIGILTFWNTPNYGTFAQAYALQKVIQFISDKDVRQIAHLEQHHFNFYFNKKAYFRHFPIWKKKFWKSFFIKNETKVDVESRENTFLKAYKTIPHTVDIDLKNVSESRFNKIFLGSDIVWDFTLEPFNHDPMLFGGGFNTDEVNSYAASFGTVKNDTPIPDYVLQNIKKMSHISVRDENSANIVEKITGKRPIVVLDPVWLWDFNNDHNVQVPDEKDYILVYGQDFTDEFIENLIKYAKEKKFKIIALDCNEDSYAWCDKLIKQQDLAPYLWFGYFKNAAIVATSTFHGLTFGLLFKKKIAFCKTDFIIAKVGGMLKKIGLYDLFENQNDVYKMLSYTWDYDIIDEYIDKERIISLNYLKEVCN